MTDATCDDDGNDEPVDLERLHGTPADPPAVEAVPPDPAAVEAVVRALGKLGFAEDRARRMTYAWVARPNPRETTGPSTASAVALSVRNFDLRGSRGASGLEAELREKVEDLGEVARRAPPATGYASGQVTPEDLVLLASVFRETFGALPAARQAFVAARYGQASIEPARVPPQNASRWIRDLVDRFVDDLGRRAARGGAATTFLGLFTSATSPRRAARAEAAEHVTRREAWQWAFDSGAVEPLLREHLERCEACRTGADSTRRQVWAMFTRSGQGQRQSRVDPDVLGGLWRLAFGAPEA